MRTSLTTIVLFTIIFSLLISYPLSYTWDSLNPNGDFESNSGWYFNNAQYSTEYKYDGLSSCKFLAANSYCVEYFDSLQFSSEYNYSLHALSFHVQNRNSTNQTITIYYDDYVTSISTTLSIASNPDSWTQKWIFIAFPNADLRDISIQFTSSTSNIYIDNVGFKSYPDNGSFEYDDCKDITSGPKDTIPGFWKRSVELKYNYGSADPFTRGCVWSTVLKSDVSNGSSADGSRVGLLSLPAADGIATPSQTFSRINYYRDIQYPLNYFPTNINGWDIKAQCKVWTNTTYFSNVTAAIMVHKLNGTTYSCQTTLYECTNTPTLITSSSPLAFTNSGDFGWVEIALLSPTNSSNGRVMYIDEFKVLLNPK